MRLTPLAAAQLLAGVGMAIAVTVAPAAAADAEFFKVDESIGC